MDGRDARLPFDDGPEAIGRRDEAARRAAADPRRNVVLEASAGTGKTTVLVNRYLNLLKAGVDPTNILAITFTRKAAAEMRQRIVYELRKAAALSVADAARWRDLRDRLGDIAISTIDAFCLSLLHEFPLEAGLDPAFDVADDTLVARLEEDALDRALAICRRMAGRDERMRLLIAHLGEGRLRRGLDALLGRRLVARGVLRRFSRGAPIEPREVCSAAARRVGRAMEARPGGFEAFVDQGPRLAPLFGLVVADLERLIGLAGREPGEWTDPDSGAVRAALDGIRGYFLTGSGDARKKVAKAYERRHFESPEAWRRHGEALSAIAPEVRDLLAAFDRDLNRVLAAGVKRAFAVADHQFAGQLERCGALDFTELLDRTLALLGRMDEFSQSRYRLEARYHHVLVDEFQDTSRAQWRLVSLLVRAWGEGAGLAGGVLPPSIFVVGDRKQSIYGFRDADATILARARRDIEALRPEGRVRRSISRSFRSAPALLAFANDLFAAVEPGGRPDRFRFGPRDAFPVDGSPPDREPRLGLVAAPDIETCADAVARETARLLAEGAVVRDPHTGTARTVAPGDVAVLFRSREGHQAYETALHDRGIPAYVYKGLGLFDADETKDLLALVAYLARPDSDLTASAFLRSRLVRVSDCALQRLAPRIADALLAKQSPPAAAALDADDRTVFDRVRGTVAAWLSLVDRLTPAEVVDRVLEESAYAYELRGPRRVQARENIKKMRLLIRKIQNRGYATLADVADHLRALSAGDESNAVIDAAGAVNLMTVHAAKGLEFPVVFLVNLCRGTGGARDPIRVARAGGSEFVSVGEFSSDLDTQAYERDVEETKRLLYVAVTRARDRLYFSSPLKDGRFEPRKGSLGSVLPLSFAALFDREPAACASPASWRGPSGVTHEMLVCPIGEAGGPSQARPFAAHAEADAAIDAFEPVESTEIRRVAVTLLQDEDSTGTIADAGLSAEAPARDVGANPDLSAEAPARDVPAKAGDQPILGLLVHRLFQYVACEDAGASRADLAARANALLTFAERSTGSGVDFSTTMTSADDCAGGASSAPAMRLDSLISRAVEAVESIRADPRVQPLLARDHRWLHEVPFSMLLDGAIVRGVVDALVEQAERVTVVEIKTGAMRPEHERQLATYRAAATMLFPGRIADAILVYARP